MYEGTLEVYNDLRWYCREVRRPGLQGVLTWTSHLKPPEPLTLRFSGVEYGVQGSKLRIWSLGFSMCQRLQPPVNFLVASACVQFHGSGFGVSVWFRA